MSTYELTPEQKIRQRYAWFQEAQRLGNVKMACLRLGISRKTFYKWKKRFDQAKEKRSSLLDRSRRPHHLHYRVKKSLRRRLQALRKKTHLGPLRLRQLLLNQATPKVPSAFTISKILKRSGLIRKRKPHPKRYRRTFTVPRPGDLLQVDVKFVPYLLQGRRLYQFTAIDCCTRLRLIQFHEEMATYTAKAFIQYALSSFPFPVRIVQTDNDSIFTHWYTAGPKTPLDCPVKIHPFTAMGQRLGATHCLIPPRTPRLNGKIERSHQTDEEEFYRLRRYSTHQQLKKAFARWLYHYNHHRLHMGLNGKTPLQALHTFPQYAHIKELSCYPC
ncbi:MAG TPA: IS481 family transposase [Thermodesulfobacteriota bacterium]|nr:IS481 family transposase [Thermodesulfobacteriota bacterium]